MISLAKTIKADTNALSSNLVFWSGAILHNLAIEIILTTFWWEAVFLRALFDLSAVAELAKGIQEKHDLQLRKAEVIVNEEPTERTDIRKVDDLKVIQYAGKKSTGKKNPVKNEEQKRKAGEERSEKREAEERERLRKWEENWEKRLQERENLDDLKCCKAEGLSLKPRTQSNIWINVVHDKLSQEVQMTFRHVPVPKPKPPPLPRLRREESFEASSMAIEREDKLDKKTGVHHAFVMCRKKETANKKES
ncbi:hypothetical protein KM043_018668 [Ampulex compressa]|nr:hypothetical protein KM043_018668 [Ampulex compressa]